MFTADLHGPWSAGSPCARSNTTQVSRKGFIGELQYKKVLKALGCSEQFHLDNVDNIMVSHLCWGAWDCNKGNGPFFVHVE